MDLAAAGGVERGLDELGQQAPVLLRDRRDRGRLLGRLVAGEDRRVAGARRERPQLLARVLAALAAGAGAGADALLLHQRLEALLVDAEAALGGELEREVEREAERVVELERLVGADALGAGVARLRDHLVEHLQARLERAVERLLLGAQPHVDRVGLLEQLGVVLAHRLAHDLGVARQEAGLDADPAALDDRAPHQAAQHVAAVLVGRDDAVGDQERHPARVVGEHAQRTIDLGAGPGALAAQLLPEADQRHELVGVEDARDALQDRGEAVEAEPGVDVLRRQRRQHVDRVLLELHEDEVPVLQEALVLAARAGRRPCRSPGRGPGRARCTGRRDRSGRPARSSPTRGQLDDPLARDADRQPRLDRLLVGADAELRVALEDRDPDVVRVEAEALAARAPRRTRRRPA